MVLTREEVAEIAQLARLALRDDELDALRGELAAILEHVEVLGQADTIGVEPMTHAVPTALRLRADQVEPSLPVAVALADAPAARDGCFEVPAIIKAAT
ncbi:MAG: Asp-tRNA(Asn)/Glu-tRNA(Gln) amidotransferase subunit GatC [Kofleriaceae bacterium]|nr:Asp-tRNA(Asn)/Glu-tRNA(Gln) amidotransferase subunit GatC [Kofleriaceae bacterium]MCL4224279.1 Asp-tRNA(Asn)/Glu-tRNA(Gln) amidotransferase subunit GatC [Myxococcales bacterium]